MRDVTFRDFASALSVQWSTIKALMIRDMMMRFGRNNLGFLWIIIEPMILTAFVLTLFSFSKSHYEHGVHVISMVPTGYMPLTMWRHTSNNGIHLLKHSIGVLYHRNTTVLDVFLGRMFIEGLGTTAALLSVYGTLLAFSVVEPVHDPLLILTAWTILWFYGMSVALVIAALTEWSEVAERFIQPFQYIMVPLSGVFFMVDWMPPAMQRLIVWIPLTNCVEMFRAGFFGEKVTTHYWVWTPVLWTILIFPCGLLMLRRARAELHGS